MKYANYSLFVTLKIEHKIDRAKHEAERVSSFSKLIDVDGALKELDALKTSIIGSLQRVRSKSDEVISNIKLQEPLDAAAQDVEKLKRAIDSVVLEIEFLQTETYNCLEKHRELCIFREDLERINSDLRDLNEQLKNMDKRLGDNLSVSKTTLVAFEQFEHTITVILSRKDEISLFSKILFLTCVLLLSRYWKKESNLSSRKRKKRSFH